MSHLAELRCSRHCHSAAILLSQLWVGEARPSWRNDCLRAKFGAAVRAISIYSAKLPTPPSTRDVLDPLFLIGRRSGSSAWQERLKAQLAGRVRLRTWDVLGERLLGITRVRGAHE
jgi:hypothetical protein